MGHTLAHGRAFEDSFEAFYVRHEPTLRRTAAKHVSGRVEADDVLQEALVGISRELSTWSHDQRLRNALRLVRCRAVDAMRHEYGTGDRPNLVPVDFEELERSDGADTAAWASEHDATRAVTDRDELLDALRRLEDHELPVVVGIAHMGGTADEVAGGLELPRNRVAYVYDEARTFLRSLLSHARGDELAGRDRLRLIELDAGSLLGRDRRRTQRHLDHCTLCRALEVIERRQAAAHAYDGPDRRLAA